MADNLTTETAKNKRKYINLRTKIDTATQGLEVQRSNHSFRSFCKEKGFQPSQVRRWIKKMDTLNAQSSKKKAKLTMHAGRTCSLSCADEVIDWIRDLHGQGLGISVNMVILKACQLESDFRRKSKEARYSVIRRLVRTHGLTIRTKTHQAQVAPTEKQEEAKLFVARMRPLLVAPNRDPRYVMNMDQTPVFFSMESNTTLDNIGARTVNVRSSSSSTMRVTFAVAVTASGDYLTPYLCFKGKPNGRIVREFSNGSYPSNAVYSVQERAWMDQSIMLHWIEKVLKPYVETAPAGVVPFLLLDSYKCHLLSDVVKAIQDLGVQVEHIPGGCTGLAQPVDVGINKPLKNRVRRKWEEYMLNQGIDMAKTTPPSRAMMATWCVATMADLGATIIKNSWCHGDYSYFPDNVVQPTDTVEHLDRRIEAADEDTDTDDEETAQVETV